jgi:aminoglycoside 6'-N-acetyltransferase I
MITVRRVLPEDRFEWARMRRLLWDEPTPEEHLAEMEEILADPLAPVFVAVHPNGKLCGFLEAGLRKYADGCDTSPVGYIEGWFVDEDLRREGVGGQLMRAAEEWARTQGCLEMASDTWLENETSISAHLALGFEESERLVHFSKKL